jgi:hypothetical protein
MWSKDYEALNSTDKSEFRRIANHLLSHTYLTRYSYQPSKQMTLPNKDYQIATRLFSLLKEYLYFSGWRLDKDDIYGFMSLINIYDNNHYRMDQFTTLFLYTCRLIYEEQREQANSFHTVLTSTSDIIEKMKTLNLLKNGKTTQKERLESQRTLAHFNLIDKTEATAWEPDGNHVLILPSILAVISNQGINDIIIELDNLRKEPGDENDTPDMRAVPDEGKEKKKNDQQETI